MPADTSAAMQLVVLAVVRFGVEKEVYLLGGLLLAYGLASALAIALAKAGRSAGIRARV